MYCLEKISLVAGLNVSDGDLLEKAFLPISVTLGLLSSKNITTIQRSLVKIGSNKIGMQVESDFGM